MSQPVLFAVDDDPAVLAAVGRDLLGRYGTRWRVRRAASGAGALSELRRLRLRGERVALLLVDQRMRGLSGVGLLREARKLFPGAKRVLLTAYADTDAAIAAINDAGLDHYLLKPWDPPEDRLFPVLDDLLDAWRTEAAPEERGIRVVASRWSAEGHDVRDFLTRNLVPFRWLDPDADDDAGQLLHAAAEAGPPALPLVVLEDGAMLARPSHAELAARVGLEARVRADVYDVVILGAGPAGLAAAVHVASEGRRTLLVERHAPGGQAGLSARIENYLGFPVGLSGGDLARRAVAQARRLGAELVSPVEATGLRIEGGHRVVTLSDGRSVAARAVLIASGVQYARLDVPGADRLNGRGIYYGGALTESVRLSGEDVHVLGGGNSAGQAAMHLARSARSVTLLVRRSALRPSMSGYLRDRIAATSNIRVRTDCALTGVAGGDRLTGLSLRDLTTGASMDVSTAALFVFIGATPHTDWLDGTVLRDAQGFVLSGADVVRGGRRPAGWTAARDPLPLETSMAGVFVAGDVRRGPTRGVGAAVGEGTMAAQLMHQYLERDEPASTAVPPAAAAAVG
jgi:thioredoxin reductase (NADPH)